MLQPSATPNYIDISSVNEALPGDESQPSTSCSNKPSNDNVDDPVDLRPVDKKIFDPKYHDEALTPYFNKNRFLDSKTEKEIFTKTKIPSQQIEGWFENQRREKWETENPDREQYVRIRNAEPELLKCFNENETYFSDESILNLMIKTGLTFDDIKHWYKCIVAKINKFFSKPNPDNVDFKSIQLGVKLDIFKNWLEIQRRVGSIIPKSARKEVLKLIEKMNTNAADHFQLNESTTNMTSKQQLLKGLYHQDLNPGVDEKILISEILNCSYDKVHKWFSSKRENKKTNWYEIAKREIEAGFSLEIKDLEIYVEAKGRKFTEQQVEFLEHFFSRDRFPSRKMIIWMGSKLKCTYRRVNNWFIKTRHKRKPVNNRESTSALTSSEPGLHFEGSRNETQARQTSFNRSRMTSSVNKSNFDRPRTTSEVNKSSFNRPRMTSEVNKNSFNRPRMTSEVNQNSFNRPRITSEINKSSFNRPRMTSEVNKSSFNRPKMTSEVNQNNFDRPSMTSSVNQNSLNRPRMTVNQGSSSSVPKSPWKNNNYFSQLAINTHLTPNRTRNSYNPLYGRQLLDLAKKEDFNKTSSKASRECVVDFELYGSSDDDMEIDYSDNFN